MIEEREEKKGMGEKWKWGVFLSIVIAILIHIFHSPLQVERLVPSRGIVLVSSCSGGGREVALRLAEVGFQVIVGVSDEAEKKSFRYSSTKGIEPMLLQLTEPGQLALLHYKLQEMSSKNERNLVGIVIVTDSTKKKSSLGDIDRSLLHELYQTELQGPIRLIQAIDKFIDYSVARFVFVKYHRAKDYLLSESSYGCGVHCSFYSTDFNIVRHHYSTTLIRQNRSRTIPSVSLVETVIGEVKLFSHHNVQRRVNFTQEDRTEYRERMRKQSVMETVSSVLHAISSSSPHEYYSIGSIDIALDPQLTLPTSVCNIVPTFCSVWRIPIDLRFVTFVREFSPPILSNLLSNFFL